MSVIIQFQFTTEQVKQNICIEKHWSVSFSSIDTYILVAHKTMLNLL